jgi:branched-chain amino acid transport system substrate-binding protein
VRAFALALLVLGFVIPRDSRLPGPEGSATLGPSARGTTSQDDKPYRKASPEPLEFRGAGREEPEPDVDEVVLGWFGPGDPDHLEFGDYWRGAVLALGQENAAGGYRGRPFRLEAAWSENPWKAGVVDVARLVHERGAWAVVGGVDGTTTHLAVQLALKSHFLLLSPGSTDVTADDANVPWLFSLAPSDEAIARALAAALAPPAGAGRFAIAAATDHDSHATLVALRRALSPLRLAPAALVEIPDDGGAVAGAVEQLLEPRPRRLVVIAPPRLGARVVAAARAAGFADHIVGGPGLARASFARAAGPPAEGVLAPLLVRPSLDEAFLAAFEARWGERPDAAAALGADAVRLVAEAVRRAGLNRPRIRDAVRALAPWSGASGTVRWDPRGRNAVLVALGRWRAGRLVPLD